MGVSRIRDSLGFRMLAGFLDVVCVFFGAA